MPRRGVAEPTLRRAIEWFKARILTPAILVLVLAGAAVLSSFNEALARFAIYDRNAVLTGELWRLFTAPLVHFTPHHLAYDALVLIVAGALLQWRGYRGFAAVCMLSPLAGGMAVLCFEPGLAFYGGSSGVATGAFVLLATAGLLDRAGGRWMYATVLLVAGLKILFEFNAGSFVFLSLDPESFRPAPLCHVAGAFKGAGVALVQRWRASYFSPVVSLVVN
jgi:rhomboid family GlyGly-CTERM serine protease